MTPDLVPAEFEQTMGCTLTDLLRYLPGALPGAHFDADLAAGVVRAVFSDGSLQLTMWSLPARRIALLEIPCLQVRFEYTGLEPRRRHEVQRRFDLGTHRGGG